MILGIGCDTIDINRIDKTIHRFGQAFLDKIFTAEECHLLASKARLSASVSSRFAAKEACLKALGTGLRRGLSWHDMVIHQDKLGCPLLILQGGVHEHLKQKLPNGYTSLKAWVSLSDTETRATAFVLLEASR